MISTHIGLNSVKHRQSQVISSGLGNRKLLEAEGNILFAETNYSQDLGIRTKAGPILES